MSSIELGSEPEDLRRLVAAQLALQIGSFKRDPRTLAGDELADFITWNAWALTEELGEAMQEVKWKPWITDGSRGEFVDRDAFVKELVDLFHFFMNLLLASAQMSGDSFEPQDLASEFAELYYAKHRTNAKRQAQEGGYSGDKSSKETGHREVDTGEIHPDSLNRVAGEFF